MRGSEAKKKTMAEEERQMMKNGEADGKYRRGREKRGVGRTEAAKSRSNDKLYECTR